MVQNLNLYKYINDIKMPRPVQSIGEPEESHANAVQNPYTNLDRTIRSPVVVSVMKAGHGIAKEEFQCPNCEIQGVAGDRYGHASIVIQDEGRPLNRINVTSKCCIRCYDSIGT